MTIFPSIIVSGEATHGSAAYQRRLDELGISDHGRIGHILLEAVESHDAEPLLVGAQPVSLTAIPSAPTSLLDATTIARIVHGTAGRWDYPIQVYARRVPGSSSIVTALRNLGFTNVVDLGPIDQSSDVAEDRRLTIDVHPALQTRAKGPVLHMPAGELSSRMHQIANATAGDWSWPITVYGPDGAAQAAAVTLRSLGFRDVTSRATPEEPLVLDLRSTIEYDAYHIPRARSIPIDALQNRISEIARATSGNWDYPIHVYCSKGDRAQAGAQALREFGFTNVTDLGGLDHAVSPVTRLELVEVHGADRSARR